MCGQFAIMKRLGFVMGFVITAAGAWAQQYVISSVAGSAGPLHANLSGFSGDGGPATSALLNDPTGVAVDGAGNLFIADTYNSAILKVFARRNHHYCSRGREWKPWVFW